MKIVIVDQQDLDRVRLFIWLAQEDERGCWRVYTEVHGQRVPLDGFVLGYSTQQNIDHLDGDDFNCCRENLEVVTLEKLVERRIRRMTGISIETANRNPF